MKKSTLFFILVIGLAALQLGSVRKKDNPILATQTEGILYEQKKEEEKDGKKGPLLYHVKNDPLETFFIEPPIDKAPKDTGEAAGTAKVSKAEEAVDWWEEQPSVGKPAPLETSGQEPAAELPVSEDKTGESQENAASFSQEVDAPKASTTDNPEAPPGQKDDYWW